MAGHRTPFKPLTRADLILRNAVEINQDNGLQLKQSISRNLFDDRNKIITSTIKRSRMHAKMKYPTVSPIKKNLRKYYA